MNEGSNKDSLKRVILENVRRHPSGRIRIQATIRKAMEMGGLVSAREIAEWTDGEISERQATLALISLRNVGACCKINGKNASGEWMARAQWESQNEKGQP